MSVFNCGCCGILYPTLHQHTHHKIPQSTGGLDTPDNLIELCPGCHDTLHNIAHKLMSKKTPVGQVTDALQIIYKDNLNAQKMCMELAVHVRNAMINRKEKGLSPNQLVSVSTTIRKKYKDMLIVRCKELNRSQDDYIRDLLLKDLSKRFNLPEDTTFTEKQAIKAIKVNKKKGLAF
jgi:hypothetical protein